MRTLSVFPLQLVAIQDEELRLHIFEPRYKALITECFEQNLSFGMPLVIDNKLMETGAELRIKKIEHRYAGGEMDIVCQVISRFRIVEFFKSKDPAKAATAITEEIEFLPDEDKELNLRLMDLLFEFYNLAGSDLPAELNDQISVAAIYHKCGLNIEQEAELAGLGSTRERQHYLIAHLKKILPVLEEIQRMKSLIKLNGHFKKLSQNH